MKIGIMGAMPEEIDSIKTLMSHVSQTDIGNRTFVEGKIADIDVVLTFSRWGKVASSSTTTTLINIFKVDSIVFTGVAGAVSPKLNIGDIVIGNGFYQHDMDARPFFDRFQIPLTDTTVMQPNKHDVDRSFYASEKFLKQIESHISKELLTKHAITHPKIQTGLIASGDQFIANTASHDVFNFSYEGHNTLAVEMEGAAVAQVCTDHAIPFTIIRIISDKADHSAAIDFQSFVSQVASIYSCQIIKELFNL